MAEPDDHGQDELLIEMRLQDIENVKKLHKEEREKRENLLKEDVTDSEDSATDESDKCDLPDCSLDKLHAKETPIETLRSPIKQVGSTDSQLIG